MYYSEKVIGGVMHFQTMPNGEWHVMTLEMLTAKVIELQRQLDKAMKFE